MQIDDELERLYAIREYINTRIKELRSFKTMASVPNPTEYGWVKATDISKYVNDWKEPWSQLARNAGVSLKTVASIRDGDTRYIREDIADRIMMALDLPHIEYEIVKQRPIHVRVPDPPPSHYFEE